MPLHGPNYERPEFVGTNFKAQSKPKVAEKVTKRRKVARMDRIEKENVRIRDKEACRVCFRKTREVHERVFKSRGGVASLDNSMCACRTCHKFLQEHGIQVFGPTCNGELEFQMNEVVARLIFNGRAVPQHVAVVKDAKTA